MTSMRRAIDEAADTLTAAGIDTARVDAEQLAAHTAGVDRGRLSWHEPDETFFDRYRELVAARARRIPLQHLTTTAAFGPVILGVGPGVFIPRPETEALLEWALAQRLSADPVIVDLCTGSGALAVALAHDRPQARVIAIDDSAEALGYARRNAAGSAVEVREADVTDPEVLGDMIGRVDLVVANPPYIPDGAVLEPEVAEHDPAHALFGGPDGMQVIAPIVALAARLLRPGGRAAVEHDDTTAAQTVAVFDAAGVFTEVTSRRDLTGRPRFVTARRQG
ncbi:MULTISPECIES: peptide chain release factor N(5)-glutamine methyltransferase [unclassified Mycobacterium]|uniref:peptide chain release factor N(5)-glutamine methyltransferase n=1 Tax=unclassified Mycobacterium TaxID=2642494 RepID=UPI0029C8BCC1|nr:MULTISPECIES: peptide chain release factor N(5)-glutamine methyltransferase [unclassified Mycobacterium]